MGVHLTSSDIFKQYIFPSIREKISNYCWVDLYCGEGNLIFPILEDIPLNDRELFFSEHIFLSDVQDEMVLKCINKAISYGISSELARKNIIARDNLTNFPTLLNEKKYPIFHITNPPYLYLGYIRKHEETQMYLELFKSDNDGYQDLYQIAMINDLRNNIKNLIYIIPANFIFGAAVSNKFRMDFLKYYKIDKLFVFEKQIFEFTGTNIVICFFTRKEAPQLDTLTFTGVKFKQNDQKVDRIYRLKPEYKYRAGYEFNEFIANYTAKQPLEVTFYLQKKEVENNKGNQTIMVIDTTEYEGSAYKQKTLMVSQELKSKVQENALYVRTVDTGSITGRVGLNKIVDDFGVDAVYVSGNTYRTCPIHVFLQPPISLEDQTLLQVYFNFMLEYFRAQTDSEFLTTYKYSSAEYTRKYLGLTQVRNLIETFPILNLTNDEKVIIKKNITDKDTTAIFQLIIKYIKKPL
ncbi:MAG: SAM-dependent DNA methyltransferase [Asgard group archaeon]|nr:SAM-dependent DNA methyltransferase [Asgard group archaeon]